MASMQVRIQLTAISHLRCTSHKVWYLLVFFDKHFVYVHVHIRGSDDINEKALRFTVIAQGLALDLCLAIQLAHKQQHQVAASTEASFLVMYSDGGQCIFSRLLVNLF